MEQFIFIPIEQFQESQERLERIESAIKSLTKKAETSGSNDKLLTRSEAAQLLGRSLTCLNDWMKKGYLPFRRIGRKVYFLESDLLKAGKKGGVSHA